MACHNICTDVEAPVGIEHLLGPGGKYCKKETKLNKKIGQDVPQIRT